MLRKCLPLLILLLLALSTNPVRAGSARVFGVDDPSADYAIDECKHAILALEPYVASANIRAYMPQLVAMSAEQLADYLPRIENFPARTAQEVDVNRMGACFARALLRYKRGQASASRPQAVVPPPASARPPSTQSPVSKPKSTEPPDIGQNAAVAAMDEVLAVPPEKLAEKKGEDAKDCLKDEPSSPGKDARIRNGCAYVITFAWCTPGVDCRANMFSHMWHLKPGETWVLDGSAKGDLQMGACKGFNTLRLFSDPPYNYGCSAEPK